MDKQTQKIAENPNGAVPFNRPFVSGRELAYIEQTFQARRLSGDGEFTKRCNTLLEEITKAPKVLLTTSCTHALEMGALLAGIEQGDEVILPSFTFVSTANAFVLRGAKPVFVDIRKDTLNINEELLEAKITPKTKAIFPVHYAGVACEMDKIMEIAQRYSLEVIEDNAQGLFGSFKGKPLGTFGSTAALSFHETKNIQCGEGGALIINDEELIERAEIIREKGTNRSRFFRGQVDKYSWVDKGSSYLPSEILAAFLCAQLEQANDIQQQRKKIWDRYHSELSEWAFQHNVGLPNIPPQCEQPYHLYYLILPSQEYQQQFMQFLRKDNIHAVFHYLPLNTSEYGLRFGGNPGDCPVTEDMAPRLVRLPLFYELSEAQQGRVIDRIHQFDFSKARD